MPPPSEDVRALHERVRAVEDKVDKITTAFVRNDVGAPDFDGHRRDHREKNEESKAIQEYKYEATKKLLTGLVGLLLTAIGVFMTSYIRDIVGRW